MCGGDSYIVTNNLGGMGPDVGQPPVIRYGKVASIEGMPIDLVPRPVSMTYPRGFAFRDRPEHTHIES